jgi:hypothetical protein
LRRIRFRDRVATIAPWHQNRASWNRIAQWLRKIAGLSDRRSCDEIFALAR